MSKFFSRQDRKARPRRRPRGDKEGSKYRPPSGPSIYEERWLGWRDRLRKRAGGEKRHAPIAEPTVWVQGTGAESGRLIGVLDEDGSTIRFPEPPADRPSEWPQSWWQPVAEIKHWRR